MRFYIVLFVSSLTLSACKNDTVPEQKHTTPEANDYDNKTQQIERVEAVETVSSKAVNSDSVGKKETSAKKPKVTGTSENVKDVDHYYFDPFEDPDYIGTPCGDYVDGRCTRHKHENEIEEPDL